jgi:hypothetical protein
VATGNATLAIVYHMQSDPVRCRDVGVDYFDTRINKERKARYLAYQLQAVTGQKITVRDRKARHHRTRRHGSRFGHSPAGVNAYGRAGCAAPKFAVSAWPRNARRAWGWAGMSVT